MDYSVPLCMEERPNLKHYIKFNDLKNFIEYPRKEKNYELSVIVEILYEFWIRASAIAKLKVKDLCDDGIIIFNEKKSKNYSKKVKIKSI